MSCNDMSLHCHKASWSDNDLLHNIFRNCTFLLKSFIWFYSKAKVRTRPSKIVHWSKNPKFSSSVNKMKVTCYILYVTFRKIPKVCWSESFFGSISNVRVLVLLTHNMKQACAFYLNLMPFNFNWILTKLKFYRTKQDDGNWLAYENESFKVVRYFGLRQSI